MVDPCTLVLFGASGDLTQWMVMPAIQNHLLQLCALVAIEPPAEWNPRAVRDEKVKALRSIRRMTSDGAARDPVRGQYGAGIIDGSPVRAYRDEPEVVTDSAVETYAAMKLHIDNVRWAASLSICARGSGSRDGAPKSSSSSSRRRTPHGATRAPEATWGTPTCWSSTCRRMRVSSSAWKASDPARRCGYNPLPSTTAASASNSAPSNPLRPMNICCSIASVATPPSLRVPTKLKQRGPSSTR